MASRLPDPWYEAALKGPRLLRSRVCGNCGETWETAEIPLLLRRWEGTAHPHKCPSHPTFPTRTSNQISSTRGRSGKYSSSGLSHTVGLGGTYRSRRCTQCNTRWVTVEVRADGVHVEDSMVCRRCGYIGEVA